MQSRSKRSKYNGPFSMDTQDTSCMRTARVEYEKEVDTRIVVKEYNSMKYGRKERVNYKEKNLK